MDRIVIVTKKTALENLISEHMTENAAGFHLKTNGESIDSYKREHEIYKASLQKITQQIPSDIQTVFLEREQLPRFLFRDNDFIIVCGPDGLLVNLSKYVDKQLVCTVNPDPQSVAGVLMIHQPNEIGSIIKQIEKQTQNIVEFPFIKVTVNNSQSLFAIGDVFIGRGDHISVRYELIHAGKRQKQSSSGIIVSSGVGASGWMRSIKTQIREIAGTAKGLPYSPKPTDRKFLFFVREPFVSPDTKTSLNSNYVTPEYPLEIISKMPTGGFIYSDGVFEEGLSWNMGDKAVVTVGEKVLKFVYNR